MYAVVNPVITNGHRKHILASDAEKFREPKIFGQNCQKFDFRFCGNSFKGLKSLS